MRFIPLGNRVVVRLPRVEAKSKGGLHLPQTANTQNTGIVEAVGKGIAGRDGKLQRPSVKVGDVVRFINATDELERGLLVVESAAIIGRYESE